MHPAGQIKFISAGGEFSLGLITSRFDFLACIVSLLAIIQWLTLLISLFDLHSKLLKEDGLTSKQVSSANKRGTLSTLLKRSLIYHKNSTGPKIDPSGTPMVTSRRAEENLLMLTNCFLFSKKG